jgi:putative peptidoglycan lipid II flippase
MSRFSLLKSTGVVGSMTLISRVLGFVRDLMFAWMIGAGPAMDVFLLALRIPNLGRRMFAEGAFSQAFVPVFTETKTKGTHEDVRDLLSVVAGTLGGVLALVTLVGCLAAPLIVWMFAPGFGSDPAKHDLAAELLRWTFPYLLFISLTALAGGVLNVFGRFAIPAVTPVILNICLIGSAFIDAGSVHILAYAVFVAGVLQFVFQLPFLRPLDLLARPRWGWHDARVRRIVKLMVPIMFGSSVAQVSLLLDTVIASFLSSGSLSWLYFADRLMEFPLGVFTIAISTVVLPSLSREHAADGPERFSAIIDWGLRLMLLLGIPAAAGLLVLAGPLIATLFGHGRFAGHDLDMTTWALMAYAGAFLGISLTKVLVPGFYARQVTGIPVRYGIISLVSGMVTSVVLVLVSVHWGFAAPHASVAMGTSASSILNAFLLYRRLRSDRVFIPLPGWPRYLAQIFGATAAMSAVGWLICGSGAGWLDQPLLERGLRLAGAMVACVAVYGGVLAVTGLRPRHLRSAH